MIAVDDIPKMNAYENIVLNVYKANKTPNIDQPLLISVYDNTHLFKQLLPKDVATEYITSLSTKYDNRIIKPSNLLDIFLDKIDPNPSVVRVHSKDVIYLLISEKKWYNRICIHNKKILVTPSFMIEYFKTYSVPAHNAISTTADIHTIISTISYHKLNKPTTNIEKLSPTPINNLYLTPIEHAIWLYLHQKNAELSFRLKQMITHLAQFIYTRPPQIFFSLLDHPKKASIDNIIAPIKTKYKITTTTTDPQTINDDILTYFLSTSNYTAFFDYNTTIAIIINKTFILKHYTMIDKKYYKTFIQLLSDDDKIIFILLTESLDLITNIIDITNIIHIGHSLLIDLIKANRIISVYYLHKLDNSIFTFDITQYVTTREMAKLILTFAPDIWTESCLISLIKSGSAELVLYLLEYLAPVQIAVLEQIIKHNRIDILSQSTRLTQLHNLVNTANSDSLYPLMLSCNNQNEDIYKLLVSMGANENIQDKDGNTVYHYICSNNMFIGLTIHETTNNAGLYPSNLTNISPHYWKYR